MFQQHISGWGLFEIVWKESPRSRKTFTYQRWAPSFDEAVPSLLKALADSEGLDEVVILNVTTLQEPTVLADHHAQVASLRDRADRQVWDLIADVREAVAA